MSKQAHEFSTLQGTTIRVPAESQRAFYCLWDRFRWLAGEADYAAPHEVGFERMCQSLKHSLERLEAHPRHAARAAKYFPTMWLVGKLKDAQENAIAPQDAATSQDGIEAGEAAQDENEDQADQ
jgi:hypothetical protein